MEIRRIYGNSNIYKYIYFLIKIFNYTFTNLQNKIVCLY